MLPPTNLLQIAKKIPLTYGQLMNETTTTATVRKLALINIFIRDGGGIFIRNTNS